VYKKSMNNETKQLAKQIEARLQTIEALIEAEAKRRDSKGFIRGGFYAECADLEQARFSPLNLLIDDADDIAELIKAEKARIKLLRHLHAAETTRAARPRLKAFRAATAALLGC
jgi:hypothetical protein